MALVSVFSQQSQQMFKTCSGVGPIMVAYLWPIVFGQKAQFTEPARSYRAASGSSGAC